MGLVFYYYAHAELSNFIVLSINTSETESMFDGRLCNSFTMMCRKIAVEMCQKQTTNGDSNN